MEEKDLEFFRNHLIKWLEELLANADETVEGLLYSQENIANPLDMQSAVASTATGNKAALL